MRNRMSNYLKLFLTLFLILFSIYISIFSILRIKYKKEYLLEEKINSQIDYIEKYIVSMINSINNISYTNYKIETIDTNKDNPISIMTPQSILLNEKNEIDWENLKFEIENIYSAWNNLFIDLNSNGVGNKDTLEFSNILNVVTNNIKNEDKSATLINLSNLYSEIIKYAKGETDDYIRTSILETKSHVLKSYVNVSNNNLSYAKTNINTASEKFGNIINNIIKIENKQASINKSYVYLKEMQKSIEIENRDIFFIYYRLLMQELDNIYNSNYKY